MILVLALATALLFATGTYLLLQRRLTRVILGASLLGHGSVLALLVAGGRTGQPAIVEPASIESGISEGADPVVSDPLVQALALTAIVITFAVTVFLLALANRRWELTGDDQVEDDPEDRRIDALVGDEQLETQFDPQPDEPELLP